MYILNVKLKHGKQNNFSVFIILECSEILSIFIFFLQYTVKMTKGSYDTNLVSIFLLFSQKSMILFIKNVYYKQFSVNLNITVISTDKNLL